MIIVHNGAHRPRIRDHFGPVAKAGFGFAGPAATGSRQSGTFSLCLVSGLTGMKKPELLKLVALCKTLGVPSGLPATEDRK